MLINITLFDHQFEVWGKVDRHREPSEVKKNWSSSHHGGYWPGRERRRWADRDRSWGSVEPMRRGRVAPADRVSWVVKSVATAPAPSG